MITLFFVCQYRYIARCYLLPIDFSHHYFSRVIMLTMLFLDMSIPDVKPLSFRINKTKRHYKLDFTLSSEVKRTQMSQRHFRDYPENRTKMVLTVSLTVQ